MESHIVLDTCVQSTIQLIFVYYYVSYYPAYPILVVYLVISINHLPDGPMPNGQKARRESRRMLASG